MAGALGSRSGCLGLPSQVSATSWTNGLPVCCSQLFRASSWEGHKHLRTRRCEKSTQKRRLLCRKLPEVPVIVLQDYRKTRSPVYFGRAPNPQNTQEPVTCGDT